MPRVMLNVPRERIVDFCKRWKITELAIFGSATRADFHPDSDIDVLVAFAPDASWSLFDHVEMQNELAAIFGRHVDLVSRRGIERSRNPIRRQSILESAEVVYVS